MEDVIVKDLKTLEFEIVQLKGQTAQNIIEIGKRLIEAKNQVPHGQWLDWLDKKVSFSQQTANNFMRTADEFPNYQSISNLGQTKIFALLNAPKEVRDELINKGSIEDIPVSELKEQIKILKQSNSRLLEDLDSAQREAAEAPKVIEKEVIKEVVKEVFPIDYEQLKKNDELRIKVDKRNKELEAEINRRDKQITELHVAIMQSEERLPSTAHKQKVINDAWEFTRIVETFLKDVGGLVYLTQSIAELPTQERSYYERSIENIWAWSNITKLNLEKEVKYE